MNLFKKKPLTLNQAINRGMYIVHFQTPEGVTQWSAHDTEDTAVEEINKYHALKYRVWFNGNELK